MKPNKFCSTCGGATYVRPSKQGERNYCSKPCYWKARNQQIEVYCFVCGTPVKRKPSHIDTHVFCSNACTAIYNSIPRTRTEKLCEYCGEVFSAIKSRKDKSKYCSVKCKNAGRVGQPHPRKDRVEKRCEVCEKSFFVKRSHVPLRRCCSPKCRGALQSANALGYDPKTRVKKYCIVCSKLLLVKPSRLDRGGGKYCSADCVGIAFRSRTGEANHNWKNGITAASLLIRASREYGEWRSSVLRRDNYQCQLCGQKSGTMATHHIKTFAKHPELRLDINNGICLCSKCHWSVNWKEEKYEAVFLEILAGRA